MYQQTEAEAFLLVERAGSVENNQWSQLYFLTKGWYYAGSAQYFLGQDTARENLSHALDCEARFSRFDRTGLFNPEKLTVQKYLDDLARRNHLCVTR